jgi:hypothetical protein
MAKDARNSVVEKPGAWAWLVGGGVAFELNIRIFELHAFCLSLLNLHILAAA